MSSDIAAVFGGQGFDTQSGEGMNSYDPLPASWYNAMIDEAAVVQTKAGTGYYLKLRFYILDQQYNGRRIFRNITLRNPNQKAEEIGLKELTSFGQAIGEPMITASAQCLNKQLQIKLKIVRDEEYGDGNDVIGYRAVGQGGAPAPQQQPTQPPAAAQVQHTTPAPAPYPQQPVYAPQPQPQQQAAPVVPGSMPWKQNAATAQSPEIPF